jgi:hypothetical protein
MNELFLFLEFRNILLLFNLYEIFIIEYIVFSRMFQIGDEKNYLVMDILLMYSFRVSNNFIERSTFFIQGNYHK